MMASVSITLEGTSKSARIEFTQKMIGDADYAYSRELLKPSHL